MTKAADILRSFNRNMLLGYENNLTIGFEDHTDPDGKLFRLEYKSTHSGDQAVSYCRYQPWGALHNSGWVCHLHSKGLICSGPAIHNLVTEPENFDHVKKSPYKLNWIVERSRYWCAVYSYYREHGRFPPKH